MQWINVLRGRRFGDVPFADMNMKVRSCQRIMFALFVNIRHRILRRLLDDIALKRRKRIYSRIRNEPSASLLAFGDCVRVKYPAPWGELAKKKLGHAPYLATGYLTFSIILPKRYRE